MPLLFFLVLSAFVGVFGWLNVSALTPAFASLGYAHTTGQVERVSRWEEPGKVTCGVRYSYRVEGRAYAGTAVGADLTGWRFGGREPLCRVLEDLGRGDQVPVAYDPAAPERALAFPAFPVGRVVWQVALTLLWGVAFSRTFLPRRG